jgi:hypothetical protein
MREHDWCEEDVHGLLRTHLYLYIQAYAIKRPTLRARFEEFSGMRVKALENKASLLDEFSYRGFLQRGGLVTQAGLCAMLGHSVTSWCGGWKQFPAALEINCGSWLACSHIFNRV